MGPIERGPCSAAIAAGSSIASGAAPRDHRLCLNCRGVGLQVLTEQGTAVDATTAAGKLVFGVFSALAEFERALTSEPIAQPSDDNGP